MSTCINSLCLPSQLQLYTTKGKQRISSLSVHPQTHNIQYSIKSFRKGKHLSLFLLYFLNLLSSPCTSSSSYLNKAGCVAQQQPSSAALSESVVCKNVCPSVTKVCQNCSSQIPSLSQPCFAELVLF